MKTFVLILAMLATPLSAQSISPQTPQTKAPSVAQPPQTIVRPTTEPTQQPIVFTAKQLDEYEDKIIKQSREFFDRQMSGLFVIMGVIVTVGFATVGILMPLMLEWQRKISFTKELKTQLSQSECLLKKYTEEQTEEFRAELTKNISSPLSMAFLGLSHSFSKELSPEAYALTLQSHVLAMKFYINSQCYGKSITASEIIELVKFQDKGNEITLDNLKVIDEVIESMKEDADKIIDDKKQKEMKSQVEELQIYVHKLIYEKQKANTTESS